MSSDKKNLFLFYKQWLDSDTNELAKPSVCYKVSGDSGATWGTQNVMFSLPSDSIQLFDVPEEFYVNGNETYLFVDWVQDGGTVLWSHTDTLTSGCSNPTAPSLTSPNDSALAQPLTVTLDWSDVAGVDTYHVQVDNDYAFGSTILDTKVTASTVSCPGLANSTKYYWHVLGIDSTCVGEYSSRWRITTKDPTPTSAGRRVGLRRH
jgi:hypothetical protein